MFWEYGMFEYWQGTSNKAITEDDAVGFPNELSNSTMCGSAVNKGIKIVLEHFGDDESLVIGRGLSITSSSGSDCATFFPILKDSLRE